MPGPPPEVTTGVLRGGALDGIVVEIDEATERIDVGPWLATWGAATRDAEPPDLPPYRFGGELDAEGRAIYVPEG